MMGAFENEEGKSPLLMNMTITSFCHDHQRCSLQISIRHRCAETNTEATKFFADHAVPNRPMAVCGSAHLRAGIDASCWNSSTAFTASHF
jgi:hypothetical protein